MNNHLLRSICLVFLFMLSGMVCAGILDGAPTAGSANTTFLPVAEAFKVHWQRTATGTAVGTYTVAPGYYLYRDRIKVSASEAGGVQLGALSLPPGEIKDDPYTGRQQVYHHSFTVTQTLTMANGQRGPVEIQAVWQGCAEAGLCYPPVKQTFRLDDIAP